MQITYSFRTPNKLSLFFISARSPLLPWLSCWSSRKQDTSPPRLPSRWASSTDRAIHPFNLSVNTNTPAKDCLHSHLCLFSALRCSRRCGGHRARRPHRSSRSRTWASLVTLHSCTASARRWWTRTPMRWGLRFYILTHNYIVLFCLYERFLCFPCFVFRSRPSEMETRKFWTSWWGWFRRRPKGGPTRFRWGQF